MLTFLQTEFLKLKRSKVFLLIILGSLAPALISFLVLLIYNSSNPTHLDMNFFLNELILYSILLFNIVLYSLLIAFLVVREYNDHTLKSVLVSPISRTKFIISKFVMFEILVILLAIFSFVIGVILAYIGGATSITFKIIFDNFVQYMISCTLLSIAMTPFLFISLIFKNSIPSVIVGVAVAFSNMLLYGQYLAPLSPYCSALIYGLHKMGEYNYGNITPVLIILLTFVVGLILSLIYFNKKDVAL